MKRNFLATVLALGLGLMMHARAESPPGMATHGTGPHTAIQKYMNAKHVPQLLAISGAAR
ncbi:MAG: hypothetical protein ACREDI_03825 [Roseiarcus sp.]